MAAFDPRPQELQNNVGYESYYKISQVSLAKVRPFTANFSTKYVKSEHKTFETEVVEALKVPSVDLHLSAVISYWMVLICNNDAAENVPKVALLQVCVCL